MRSHSPAARCGSPPRWLVCLKTHGWVSSTPCSQAASIVGSSAPVVDLTNHRVERMKRDLALEHAAGRVADEVYFAQMTRLRAESAVVTGAPQPPAIDPDEAISFIEGIAATWNLATPEERTRLVQATYERVTVKGPNVVKVKLTPMAERIGLPALLPEKVEVPVLPTRGRPRKTMVMARPTGVGRALTTYVIPIEGRAEWLAGGGLRA